MKERLSGKTDAKTVGIRMPTVSKLSKLLRSDDVFKFNEDETLELFSKFKHEVTALRSKEISLDYDKKSSISDAFSGMLRFSKNLLTKREEFLSDFFDFYKTVEGTTVRQPSLFVEFMKKDLDYCSDDIKIKVFGMAIRSEQLRKILDEDNCPKNLISRNLNLIVSAYKAELSLVDKKFVHYLSKKAPISESSDKQLDIGSESFSNLLYDGNFHNLVSTAIKYSNTQALEEIRSSILPSLATKADYFNTNPEILKQLKSDLPSFSLPSSECILNELEKNFHGHIGNDYSRYNTAAIDQYYESTTLPWYLSKIENDPDFVELAPVNSPESLNKVINKIKTYCSSGDYEQNLTRAWKLLGGASWGDHLSKGRRNNDSTFQEIYGDFIKKNNLFDMELNLMNDLIFSKMPVDHNDTTKDLRYSIFCLAVRFLEERKHYKAFSTGNSVKTVNDIKNIIGKGFNINTFLSESFDIWASDSLIGDNGELVSKTDVSKMIKKLKSINLPIFDKILGKIFSFADEQGMIDSQTLELGKKYVLYGGHITDIVSFSSEGLSKGGAYLKFFEKFDDNDKIFFEKLVEAYLGSGESKYKALDILTAFPQALTISSFKKFFEKNISEISKFSSKSPSRDEAGSLKTLIDFLNSFFIQSSSNELGYIGDYVLKGMPDDVREYFISKTVELNSAIFNMFKKAAKSSLEDGTVKGRKQISSDIANTSLGYLSSYEMVYGSKESLSARTDSLLSFLKKEKILLMTRLAIHKVESVKHSDLINEKFSLRFKKLLDYALENDSSLIRTDFIADLLNSVHRKNYAEVVSKNWDDLEKLFMKTFFDESKNLKKIESLHKKSYLDDGKFDVDYDKIIDYYSNVMEKLFCQGGFYLDDEYNHGRYFVDVLLKSKRFLSKLISQEISNDPAIAGSKYSTKITRIHNESLIMLTKPVKTLRQGDIDIIVSQNPDFILDIDHLYQNLFGKSKYAVDQFSRFLNEEIGNVMRINSGKGLLSKNFISKAYNKWLDGQVYSDDELSKAYYDFMAELLGDDGLIKGFFINEVSGLGSPEQYDETVVDLITSDIASGKNFQKVKEFFQTLKGEHGKETLFKVQEYYSKAIFSKNAYDACKDSLGNRFLENTLKKWILEDASNTSIKKMKLYENLKTEFSEKSNENKKF